MAKRKGIDSHKEATSTRESAATSSSSTSVRRSLRNCKASVAQTYPSERSKPEASPGEKFRSVPVVTLFVGIDRIPYHVHQSILCDASKVFKAAFSGKFKESSNRSMSLPDDEIDAVERMIRWLYSEKIPLTNPISSETTSMCYWELAKLGTLADKYDITNLNNSIIDELYELQKPPKDAYPPKLSIVHYVYANTTVQSFYRKLLVAWYSWHIDLEWYDNKGIRENLAKVPEFAVDLAIAFGTRLKYPDRKDGFALDRSHYYGEPT